MHAWLEAVLVRDLEGLKRELAAYPSDTAVWATPRGVTNSAGTLALHLAGNLQHYLGAMLGGSGYLRDRAAEFGRRDAGRAELLAEIDRAADAVRTALRRVPPPDLSAPFPEAVGGFQLATGDFLLHLASHTGYHLGQLDYHRRLVTGDGAPAGAIALGALSSAVKVRPAG
jgi:uncharacterized damage-inducible protein DinB